MSKIKKILLVTVPALALVLASASLASAHGPFGGWMEKSGDIADHFAHQAEMLGLSVDQVKNAWAEGQTIQDLMAEYGIDEDAFRAKMQAERHAQMEARLAEMVSAGVITQAQADTRLAWMAERAAGGDFGPGQGFGGPHGGRGQQVGD